MPIEMRALWLVKDYIISCYNHPAWGDNTTEALILTMAAVRFLDDFKETIKMEENSIALIITWQRNNNSPQAQWILYT